jgi:DNA-binding transcriptional LysR family regulator
MELKHLKSFLSVAEELSFRKAAQRAGVTQPALSQHVAKLEAELGTRLFMRDRRGVTLTPAGQTLKDEAPAALAALERVVEATRRVGGLREKTLRVGQLQYSSHAYLPGALQSLQRARPDVLVELVELPGVEAVAAVKEGVVDIGFGLGPTKDVDLVSRDVIHGRWVVWLPRKHPLAALDEVPVTALASESVILFSRSLNPARSTSSPG